MNRDRARRSLESCRSALRKTCTARNRSAAIHWALQIHARRECLKHYFETEPPEILPRR
jgi:hypothetical protein